MRDSYSLVAKHVVNMDRRVDVCEKYLHDLLQARLQDMERFGDDWSDKPVRLSSLRYSVIFTVYLPPE